MLQPRGQTDLALEPLRAHRGSQLAVEHLEGDGTVVPQVERQIDSRHSAAPQLALDGVAPGERSLERRARIAAHAVPSISF